MKKALAILAQIVLFFAMFAAFSFLQPFGIHWFVSHLSPTVTRYFVADGFLLATALFALMLLLEAVSKRIERFGVLTTISYVAAVALGFAVKLGFVTHDLLG